MEWKNQFCSRDGSTGSKFLCISILTALASFTNATYIDVFERNQPYAPESSPPFRSQGAHHQRSHVVHARSRRSSYLLSANPTKEEVPRKPFFDNPGIKRNVTTTIGQTAYLHCHVAQLGNKAQVSWIRKRDLHVLSSGVVVFASDQRFQAGFK
ncbi:hypothetical protein SK128_005940 [Halocaridina rubra]|uniref:Ig-like domain-containing protein n=1 Tax=Halocaridina rubra TaxID=373956 RepID=A0AAN8WKJ6_HALRR